MRKGFNGLHGLVRDRLELEPRTGHLFLFSNQSRNRLKILFWDGNGLWVCAKRLERGRFSWPRDENQGNRVRLTHEELSLFLGGIDLEIPPPSILEKELLKRNEELEETVERLKKENRILRELRRSDLIKKYGPGSESLDAKKAGSVAHRSRSASSRKASEVTEW
jgi:transposase